MKRISCLLLLALSGGVPGIALAETWRCGTRIVSTGDFAAEVRNACGEPASIERRSEMRSLRDARTRAAVTKISQIEEWSYRKDGRELLRTLVFEDGRLIAIQVGGRPPVDSSRCVRQMFAGGTTLAEVQLACGDPASRDRWVEIVEAATLAHPDLITGKSVTHERWVYNFGPERFLRIFEFEDGRLVEQKTGSYGFTPTTSF